MLFHPPIHRVGMLATLLVVMVAGVERPPECDHACRFWGVIGVNVDPAIVDDQLVSGKHSLLTLASTNDDGWGITYFAPGHSPFTPDRPQVLRGGPRADHAYDTRYSEAVAEMLDLEPECAVVHIRAATTGHTGLPDPHPFHRGRLVFAHNGTIYTSDLIELLEADDPSYLAKHPPDYVDPHIDSELYFLYVQKLLLQGVPDRSGDPSHSLRDALPAAVLRLLDQGAIQTAANCMATCGDTLYALRFDRNDIERYKVRYKKTPGGWTIASEPVGSDTTGWEALPPKSLGIFTTTSPPDIVTVYPPPTDPYVTVSNLRIDDDMNGASKGNGDEQADAGEIIELVPLLENEGGRAAVALSVRLRTDEAHCEILDSVAVYPDILPGEVVVPESPFVLAISPDAPPGFTLDLALVITTLYDLGWPNEPSPPEEASLEWTRPLEIYVQAPEIDVLSPIVDARLLMPGDEADIRISLRNEGNEDAIDLEAILSSPSEHVSILQGSGIIDRLMPGETAELEPPFRIAVDPSCPDPEILGFDLDISADWGITAEGGFELPVGGFADAMEEGAGDWSHEAGMPGYGNAWHLSDLQNHTPDGVWSWKCGSPELGEPYDDLLDAMLTTPEIPLAPYTELRFWHLIQAECEGGVYGDAIDGGLVEASINGGPWHLIYPDTGYDRILTASSPPGPFPPDTPVFAGWSYWREAVFVIEGFTGLIRFRFRFGSNVGNEGVTPLGWHIDDLRIWGSKLEDREVMAGALDIEALPPAAGIHVGGPSPFRDQTTILLDIAREGHVELRILDLEGRVIRALASGRYTAGRHRIRWDGLDDAGLPVPTGLYFYRMRSEGDGLEEVQRVIRLR